MNLSSPIYICRGGTGQTTLQDGYNRLCRLAPVPPLIGLARAFCATLRSGYSIGRFLNGFKQATKPFYAVALKRFNPVFTGGRFEPGKRLEAYIYG
jgi:hypothetical protein